MRREIREVVSLKDLKQFLLFPYRLYRKSAHWVPPLFSNEWATLRNDLNPAFEYCEAKFWVAFKNGKPAGRIAGIINHKFIEKWKMNCARFGFMEFIDDAEISGMLFRTFELWAREKGFDCVHGPMGFNTFDKQGVLVEGFSEIPTIASVYNSPYYPEHYEKHGYLKESDYVEYYLNVPKMPPEKPARIANLILKKNKFRILTVNRKKELLPFAGQVFELLNEAYESLTYTTPLTKREISQYVKKYFAYVIPEYILLILDSANRLAGVFITIPSLSRAFQKAGGRLMPFGFWHILQAVKHSTTADFYLIGIRPDCKGLGLNAVFMHEINKIFLKKGVTRVEINSMLETNKKVIAHWSYYDAHQHRRKRIYVKPLIRG